jgi:hypothetical protein
VAHIVLKQLNDLLVGVQKNKILNIRSPLNHVIKKKKTKMKVQNLKAIKSREKQNF